MNTNKLTKEQEDALKWAYETIWKFDPDKIPQDVLDEEERRANEMFKEMFGEDEMT